MAAEQAVIDRAYARLDDMRQQARAVSADVLEQGRGGTHQARFERDVRVEVTERRLAALREADAGLVFGRIDRDDGERLYVGRVAISSEDNEPLVVDWRAPAAEAFYRATPGQPLGLARRRHFLLRGRRLIGIEDDLLAIDLDVDGDESGLVLVGEAALLSALRRARTGRMADIVATIQREQDEIIRAPLPGVLVVQGGPGTGKTAVALHRAAYLLYTYRFPLERAGVLLVGPNRVFLRYIEQVLPSLGEHTVTFATPATLVPAVTVSGHDTAKAAEVKGDVRMASLVARAVRQRQRGLPKPATIPLGAHLLTLTPDDSVAVVNRVKRRRGTHNERRPTLDRQVSRLLLAQWREKEQLGADEPLPDDLERQLRRQRAYVAAVERMWPVLTPENLLHDLFGIPALLKLAAGSLLGPDEWQALVRPRQRRTQEVAWTEDDIALLDEATVHLGPVPSRARPVDTGPTEAEEAIYDRAMEDVTGADAKMLADVREHLARWTRDTNHDHDQPDAVARTFGHVIIDEAQDLSPMQARMIGRRVPSGSMTIVGDLGQASGEHSARRWDDVFAHLPAGRRPARVVELSVNYRTPSEVMDLAARVLAAATPGLAPPRSVRSTGEPPRTTSVAAEADLGPAAAAAARAALARSDTGRVAVIAPEARVGALAEAIGVPAADRAASAVLDSPIAVYPVEAAKGLEFDAVVLVEPSEIVAERRNGLRALYVALTRTTHTLHLVHSQPLPVPLAGMRGGQQGLFLVP